MEDLQTPVWAIETHRADWLSAENACQTAYRFYRERVYGPRPGYGWKPHVSLFHEEVAHQIREAFPDSEVTNDDGLFLLHLGDSLRVRFSAVHRGGYPNLNKTRKARAFLGQGYLFPDPKEGWVPTVLVGWRLDPAWEEGPIVTVNHYSDGAHLWTFEAEDAEMDRVLAMYNKVG